MKGFIAVARREFLERRFVFFAAAFVSLFPLLLPLVRDWKAGGVEEARSWIALTLGVIFVLALAVGLGASMFAPSLASRRIGFDFARPVSSLALWTGGLGAALLVAVLTSAIVAIPAWLAGARIPWGDILVEGRPPRVAWILAAGGFVVLVAAAHAVSVMLRSRSGLIVLDVSLALAAFFALTASLSRLPTFFADEARRSAVWGFALAFGVGLLAAGYACLERGRTDIRAAHRALSAMLWSFVAIGLAGVVAWAAWVRSARPDDLASGFRVLPAPAGNWIQLKGRARETSASFLYDTTGRRFERPLIVEWERPAFSRDGKLAAWVEGRAQGPPLEVVTMSLSPAGGKPTPTRILLPAHPALLSLSSDGSRLATLEKGLLSVHDVAGGRTLASARIPTERASIRGFFVGNDRFRVYRQPDGGPGKTHLEIFELDAATKTLSKTGEVERESGSLYFVANASGDRLVTAPESWLLDGRTGATLAKLAPPSGGVLWPGFLADGRILLSEWAADGARRLHVFRPGGEEVRAISLPAGRSLFLGGETSPGRVVLAVSDGSACSSHLVDVDDGTVRRLADGICPVARLDGNLPSEAGAVVGSEATKLFVSTANRKIVRLDIDTGAQTEVFPGRTPGEPTQ